MLNTISWQQYITAVLLITAAWYAYVGLRYYRPALSAFLKIKPAAKNELPPVAAAPLRAVMGGIQADTGTEQYEGDELVFAPGQPDDISDATVPKGPADELLAEAETLVSAFTESGSKKDFLSLLNVLVEKYEIYRDEISLPAVSAAMLPLSKQLPFELTLTDLNLNWPVENYA